MKHGEVVDKACNWLRWTERCPLVAKECAHIASAEVPDAIGWRPRHGNIVGVAHHVSTVVECKASLRDFYRNRNKPNQTLGNFRYILIPQGIVTPEMCPDGWGLLELLPSGRIKRTRRAEWNWNYCARDEITFLVAELRRQVEQRHPWRKNGVVLWETKRRKAR